MQFNWLDWIFVPIAVLGRIMGVDPNWFGAVHLFIVMSLTMLVLSVAGYLVVRWLQLRLVVMRPSLRGLSIQAARRSAARRVRVSSFLARLRLRTGVSAASAELPSKQPVLDSDGRRSKAGRSRIFMCFGDVWDFMLAAIRASWLWLRSPLGAYAALGSIWVAVRPDLGPATGLLSRAIRDVTSPGGLAVLGLVVGVIGVLLAHGLSSRLRGRNAFRRDQAAKGEQILAEMAAGIPGLVGQIDESIDYLSMALPSIFAETVGAATDGHFLLADGIVTRREPTRSNMRAIEARIPNGREQLVPERRHKGQDDLAEEALSSVLQPLQPGGTVRTDVVKADVSAGELLAAEDNLAFAVALHQAPAPARPLLWRLRLAGSSAAALLRSEENVSRIKQRLAAEIAREINLQAVLGGR